MCNFRLKSPFTSERVRDRPTERYYEIVGVGSIRVGSDDLICQADLLNNACIV